MRARLTLESPGEVVQHAMTRVAAAVCGFAIAAAAAAQEGRSVEWPVYGGSLAAQHYSPT